MCVSVIVWWMEGVKKVTWWAVHFVSVVMMLDGVVRWWVGVAGFGVVGWVSVSE